MGISKEEMKTRYLVTGASGQLGSQLIRMLGEDAVFTDLPEVDITDCDSVFRVVEKYDPRWIINCAAVTDVDLCERDPKMAMKVHRDG
ncbi:MAG: sugar nucleotide-binding protein, partial [Candidatus Aegiribacteria sp.]|nr:sugar nucleotide-binding protein [Candidatus Aegiribacteria sp.]MBD3294391.1 sugar nucleotide-binding protein [Candidatus Fermentibacteria bacterium]